MLYINDLPDVCTDCKFPIYADDFCFYVGDRIENVSEFDLVIKRWGTDCYRDSFRIGALRLWDDLPHDLRAKYRWEGLSASHPLD